MKLITEFIRSYLSQILYAYLVFSQESDIYAQLSNFSGTDDNPVGESGTDFDKPV